MREDGSDRLVLEMIGAAVLAGAYRTLARAEPVAERGLLKLADKHSARVGALAQEITAGARQGGFGAASAIYPRTTR